MRPHPLLLELLISGFFAIACFRARAEKPNGAAVRPADLLRLTDRLERLRQTRWQWFAMVLVIVVVRLQVGVPLLVEVTAALQFVLFLAMPVQKQRGLEIGAGAVIGTIGKKDKKVPARLSAGKLRGSRRVSTAKAG